LQTKKKGNGRRSRRVNESESERARERVGKAIEVKCGVVKSDAKNSMFQIV